MDRRKFLSVAAGVVGLGPSAARVVQTQSAPTIMDATRSWLTRLPKVELHVHIEGAVPKAALWQLVSKYGGDPSAPTFAAFERQFEYQGLKQFFQTFDWATSFLREPEDFTVVGQEIARDFARQNIRYVEAHSGAMLASPVCLSTRLGQAFHTAAIREMCRVAAEVRVFPLLALGGEGSPFIDTCGGRRRCVGGGVAIERVPYEFQRGGNEMMRVRAGSP